MPTPAAQEVHAALVADRKRLVVLVEIGDVLNHRRQAMIAHLGVVGHDGRQGPEVLAERHELVVGDPLAGKNEHGIHATCLLDFLNLKIGQWHLQIEPVDAGGDCRMYGFDG